VWLTVGKNDHVSRQHLHGRVRVAENETFAFCEDVEQHHAFCMRQNDGSEEFGIGRIESPGGREFGAEKHRAGQTHDT
jgi:hypothetical protein